MATAATSSFISALEVSDVIRCIICKGESASNFIQFSCFHICHKDCAKELLRNISPGSNFRCPKCKGTSLCSVNKVDDLPDEPLHHKMLAVSETFSNSIPACKICETFDQDEASTHFCLTCRVHLCATDTKRHNALPDHEIITNAETQSEKYLARKITSNILICSEHTTDSKVLEFYCQKCHVPVCQICNGTYHKFHESISIQEANKKLKQELIRKTKEIQVQKAKNDYILENLETLLQEVENDSKQQVLACKNWGEELNQTIDNIVNEYVQTIEQNTQFEMNKIIKIAEMKSDHNKQLQSAKDYMELFLKLGSNLDFLKNHKIFIDNLNSCLQPTANIEIPIKVSNMEFKDIGGIEKKLKDNMKLQIINEKRHIPPQLCSCDIKTKWETRGWRSGVAVEGEEIFAVKGKIIEIYGIDGRRNGEIKCEVLGHAWDIEVVNGQFYVSSSDRDKRAILIINRNGEIKRKISLPEQEHGLDKIYIHPLGVAIVCDTEDLYIASADTNTVYKCHKDQSQALPFIVEGLDYPCYICVTPEQELVVSNTGANTVSKYDHEGSLVWKYGTKGKEKLNGPKGICMDSWGNIFIADFCNHRIHHLSPEGKFMSFLNCKENILYPWAITMKCNNIIITSDSKPCRIMAIRCNYS